MPAAASASKTRRRPARLAGDLEARSIAARIGREFRTARLRRRLTQAQVAEAVGVHQSRISQIELGRGLGAPVGLWIAFRIAVGRPLAVAASRDLEPEPADAGHLGAQEAVLRFARATGVARSFELRTRPAPNAQFIDVGLRYDLYRTLGIIEIWNRFGELGASSRSFSRKLLEAEELAVLVGGDDEPYRVTGCWVIRATSRQPRAGRTLSRDLRGPAAGIVTGLGCRTDVRRTTAGSTGRGLDRPRWDADVRTATQPWAPMTTRMLWP
jgi:transcriptional regulator with XRE-family HTH domain